LFVFLKISIEKWRALENAWIYEPRLHDPAYMKPRLHDQNYL
jgi:hypothetical protein